MKPILLALTTIASSFVSNDAFTPLVQQNKNNVVVRKSRRNTPQTLLFAESLEGWKIDGILKPVNNFILVEKAKEQSESDGGILLSNSVRT